MRNITRTLVAMCTLLVGAVGGLLAYAPGASAQTIYPSGCHTWAYGSMTYPTDGNNDPGDWNANCWVGESNSYLNYANYVAAVQDLIQTNGYGCDPHGVDGSAGSNTNAAIECWQRARGLGADGVVGPSTWQSLGYHTLYNPVLGWDNASGSWYYTYNEFNINYTYFIHVSATNGYWYVGDCGSAGVTDPEFGLDTSPPCNSP